MVSRWDTEAEPDWDEGQPGGGAYVAADGSVQWRTRDAEEQVITDMQAATAGQGKPVRVRFCTNCKWVERGWTGRMKRTPKCLHPEVATTDRRRYFLDGTKRVAARPYAEACREGSCGSEGRFYEARSEAQAALEALGG